MHISTFRVQNYKSFLEPPEIVFQPGFNVIAGQNNVGKTALLEALSLTFAHHPHRSLKTVPAPSASPMPHSSVTVDFVMSGEELADLLIDSVGDFYVPWQAGVQPQPPETFPDRSLEVTPIRCTYSSGSSGLTASGVLPALGEPTEGAALYSVDRQRRTIAWKGIGKAAITAQVATTLAGVLRSCVYVFKAERFHVSQSRFGNSTELAPNAANLPEVLNKLQSNTARFERFNAYVTTILPQVRRITVRPSPTEGGHVEIVVWTIDPTTERIDLAMPLAESGTGIGQVLAILYVVLNSDYPRVIVIDEPQSFLHPGAVRKLLEILRLHAQHQFIITTHSPIALTAAEPETILLIRKHESESSFETLNVGDTSELRVFLSEIGARLSDVFGADGILWVEGRTEELCFALILNRIAKGTLQGNMILGVLQTGDFEGRSAERTVEIYTRLSQGRGLLPPAIGFIFDREGKSETQQEDIRRRSKGVVVFTPRRMYENYLLNPAGISAVVSNIEGFRDGGVSEQEIVDWIEAHRWDGRYFENVPGDSSRTQERWVREAHGARFLKDMFDDLSERRVQYDKVAHGVALTEWLLDNAPDSLAEIAALLTGAIDRQAGS